MFDLIQINIIIIIYFVLEEALERDNFLSPEEAKEFRLIDRVLSHPPDSGSKNSEDNQQS